MLTPQQSAIYTQDCIKEFSKIIKRKFSNLTVEETIALAVECANVAHAVMLREIMFSEQKP